MTAALSGFQSLARCGAKATGKIIVMGRDGALDLVTGELELLRSDGLRTTRRRVPVRNQSALRSIPWASPGCAGAKAP